MHKRKPVSLRFSNWVGPEEDAFNFFSALIKPLIKMELELVSDIRPRVDIEISSVYGNLSKSKLSSRVFRLVNSKLPGGVPFGKWAESFNLQPSKKAKINIFYTGENERPPFGPWDAYLSFDLDSYSGKNAYLPLWWFTCTDLDGDRIAPYLGRELSLAELLSKRKVSLKGRTRFCVAFVGKAYPFRLNALARLSDYKAVDIYGSIARKNIENKFEASQKYRFVFCFENDLYPGYVTEKVLEAWGTGAIPLYWGSDPAGYINPKAIINLNEFISFDAFMTYVKKVDTDPILWKRIAEQPILLKAPQLDDVNKVLTKALKSLIK
jgi:hypothetical protein